MSISIFTGAASLASIVLADQENHRPIVCFVITHLRPLSQSNLNISLSAVIRGETKDKILRK